MDSQPSDSGDRNANRWEDTRARRLDRSSDNAPAPRPPNPVETPVYGPSSEATRSSPCDILPQRAAAQAGPLPGHPGRRIRPRFDRDLR